MPSVSRANARREAFYRITIESGRVENAARLTLKASLSLIGFHLTHFEMREFVLRRPNSTVRVTSNIGDQFVLAIEDMKQ